MDKLAKGEKVVQDKYGRTQIVTKKTVGTAKPQNKYYPRPKKAKVILKVPKNSGGKKANAVSAPFYGRAKRK